MTEVAAGAAPAPPQPRAHGLRWWHEVGYCVLVYVAYSAVRNQFGSGAGDDVDPRPAFHHAEAIIQLERNMHLYFEEAVQRWYLDLPADGLIRVWNVYYGVFHFVITAVALIWLYRAAPARYRLWRNTLAITTLLALVGFASFSLMPPRLMDDPGIYGGCQVYAADTDLADDAGEVVPEPDGGVPADAGDDVPSRAREGLPDRAGEPPCDEFGYVDTIARYGGWASFGSDEMAAVSNQYAAMPSMHIGWSTWSAFVLVPLLRRRWLKALAVAYPFITLFDIVVTANHYWIDGIGGLICLGLGYLIARAATNWYERRFGRPESPDAADRTPDGPETPEAPEIPETGQTAGTPEAGETGQTAGTSRTAEASRTAGTPKAGVTDETPGSERAQPGGDGASRGDGTPQRTASP